MLEERNIPTSSDDLNVWRWNWVDDGPEVEIPIQLDSTVRIKVDHSLNSLWHFV